MEIIKKQLKKTITRITIGNELNESKKDVIGSVELDIENQAKFIELITNAVDSEPRNIILDISNISYLDSSGLWALFESHKIGEQKQKKVALLNPTKDVKRVLDVTKISTKIRVFTNEKEAIKALQ